MRYEGTININIKIGPTVLTMVLLGLVAIGALVASVWVPDVPVESLTARWAPPPSQFVNVNGLRVHLRDEGVRDDSVPVVLIHGTSSSLHTWQGWTDSLRTTRRVIRFDLPGFGLTGPSADGDYRIESYVRFVTAVLDTLGVRRAVVAGNSLGGWIAWRFAVAQPARVQRLVLVDAVGYPFVSASTPIGFRLARIPGLRLLIQRLLPRSVVEASVRNVFGHPERVTPELVDRYFDLTRREGNRAALPKRLQAGEADRDTLAVKSIRVPTLVLWGGLDRLVPPTMAVRFGRDIPGSKVVMFPELGHVPMEEDAAATVAAMRAFLATPLTANMPQPTAEGAAGPEPTSAAKRSGAR